MNIENIPTPETDAASYDISTNQGDGWVTEEKRPDGDWTDSDVSRDLERRLTVARAALEKLVSTTGGYCHGSWESRLSIIAHDALTLTAPKP